VEAQAAPVPRRSGAGRYFRVLGALAALGVAVLGARTVVGAATLSDDHAHATYPLSGNRLVIDGNGSTSSVRITAGAPGRVEVDRTVFHDIQRPPVTQRMERDHLQLGLRCPNFMVVRCESRYELKVPPSVSLKIDVPDGEIRVSGINGAMDLRSDSGAITLQGGSGTTKLASNDGAIRASRLAATTVEASSDSGRIALDLALVPQRVAATSRDGSIRIQVPAGPTAYDVRASSTDGRVTVAVPTADDSPRRISATSDSGGVVVRRAG
jgi:Putative adhesin